MSQRKTTATSKRLRMLNFTLCWLFLCECVVLELEGEGERGREGGRG